MNAATIGGLLLVIAIVCITLGVGLLFGAAWALIAIGVQLASFVVVVPRLRVESKPHG